MPPGAQVLKARIAGYVVEAAIPRFISREGNLVAQNDWGISDRLVDDDGSMLTHKEDDKMQNRDMEKPLFGARTDAK